MSPASGTQEGDRLSMYSPQHSFFMFSRINGVENRGGKMTPRGGCDTKNGLGPSVLVWEGLTCTHTRCSSSVGSSQTPCVCYTDMDRCRWSQTVPLVPDASRGPMRWIRLRKRVWTIGTGLWGSPDRTSSADTLYEGSEIDPIPPVVHYPNQMLHGEYARIVDDWSHHIYDRINCHCHKGNWVWSIKINLMILENFSLDHWL
jgi:hypothetical protein